MKIIGMFVVSCCFSNSDGLTRVQAASSDPQHAIMDAQQLLLSVGSPSESNDDNILFFVAEFFLSRNCDCRNSIGAMLPLRFSCIACSVIVLESRWTKTRYCLC